MAQFIFKLDGVLGHRKNLEREKQRDLAVVQVRMTELENKLRALDADVQLSNDTLRRDHLTGPINMGFLVAHRRYLAATQKLAIEIAQAMAVVQRELDAARVALTVAARDRKVLEKLRENQQETWQQDFNRKQQAEQDEAAMQMYFRSSNEVIRVAGRGVP